jgi:hypothetical protein
MNNELAEHHKDNEDQENLADQKKGTDELALKLA